MSRYYKCVNDNILSNLKEHVEHRRRLHVKAAIWGESVGAVKTYASDEGFFGMSIAGFEPSDCTDELRHKCTKPNRKTGLIRPKKTGDKKFYEKWSKVRKECYIGPDVEEKILGFNHLSFFPKFPGLLYRPKSNLLLWIMPDEVKEVPGCVEITNIEYIALKDESEG